MPGKANLIVQSGEREDFLDRRHNPEGRNGRPLPPRIYTPDELENFAKYRVERARYRPGACVALDSEPCWVTDGPPSISAAGGCTRCQGYPKGGR